MPKISKAEGPTIAGVTDVPETADRAYAPASIDGLAEAAYCAYAGARDWRAYDGSDLPDWNDQDDDIAEAWRVVARDLRGRILEPGGAQAPVGKPYEGDDSDSENDPDRTDDGDETGPVDDDGRPYPAGASAAEIESWVAGNQTRAAYALEQENGRDGGPRAGLSASLRRYSESGSRA